MGEWGGVAMLTVDMTVVVEMMRRTRVMSGVSTRRHYGPDFLRTACLDVVWSVRT
jgi:hypothetical protein